jgi:hypothetical protein
MKNRRLTIAGIQIYFDDAGTALFDGPGKERATVELALAECRDFIDRWLEVSEEARPRSLTIEEQQFRKFLNGIAKAFKSAQFDRGVIEELIRGAMPRRAVFLDLTSAQIEESIGHVMSAL